MKLLSEENSFKIELLACLGLGAKLGLSGLGCWDDAVGRGRLEVGGAGRSDRADAFLASNLFDVGSRTTAAGG